MLCLTVYMLISSGCYALSRYAGRWQDAEYWIVYDVIVTRSIAVLPVNWATMAVRSIDHKSAFKMSFNIYFVYLKFFKKIHTYRIHPVEWFQEGFYCWVSCSFKYVSLSVSRRSQTAGRNSCSIVSGNVSNCSYRLTVYPVTSSRLSSAWQFLYTRKTIINYHKSRPSRV